MANLDARNVTTGDILIYKSFAAPLLMTSTHAIIRAGQFVTGSPIHSNSVHAAIAVSSGIEPVRVIESTGQGVNYSDCTVEADVFRFTGDRKIPLQAADVAQRLEKWTKAHKTSGGKPAGHYNQGRSAFSVVRLGYYGKQAKQLVADVRKAIETDTNYEDGFFCSMLVALCYDVAGEELGLPSPPIPKDPMNLNPANLHWYLLRTPKDWRFMGTLNEPSGWATRLGKKESRH